jgi:hypothetical protein
VSALIVVKDRVLMFAGSPTLPGALLTTTPEKGAPVTVLRKSTEMSLDSSFISVGEPLEFPTENGKTAFGYL